MIVSKTHSSTPSSPGVSEPFVDDILQGDPIGTMGHQGQRGGNVVQNLQGAYICLLTARATMRVRAMYQWKPSQREQRWDLLRMPLLYFMSVPCIVFARTLLRDGVEHRSPAHRVGETQRRIRTRTTTVRLWHAMTPIFHPYG